jgi:hypothetical protein
MIPCSKGPYLASFRRSVKFVPETAGGLRDKSGYDALLIFIDALEKAKAAEARLLMRHLLYRFVVLRNVSRVPLSKTGRWISARTRFLSLPEATLGLLHTGHTNARAASHTA